MNFELPFNRPIKKNTKFVVGFIAPNGSFFVSSQHTTEKAAAKQANWCNKNCAQKDRMVKEV